MQTHPTPSAHACTTLPPGNLPVRDRYPFPMPEGTLYTSSDCGRLLRSFQQQFAGPYLQAPIGTWKVFEQRIDTEGETWIKKDQGIHYVVDDFGFLARVNGKGGAA